MATDSCFDCCDTHGHAYRGCWLRDCWPGLRYLSISNNSSFPISRQRCRSNETCSVSVVSLLLRPCPSIVPLVSPCFTNPINLDSNAQCYRPLSDILHLVPAWSGNIFSAVDLASSAGTPSNIF